MKRLLAALLAVIELVLSGCAGGRYTRPSSLTSLGYNNVSIYAQRYSEGNSAHTFGKDVDDSSTAKALWDIIAEQESCGETKGTNYLPGTPRLIITDKYDRSYTVSYTWCSEEYTTDSYGMPVEVSVGECFLITGDKLTKRYSVKDAETRGRFEQLIYDFLGDGSEFTEKNHDSDAIVFVERQTNYAWGKVDRGSFIDIHGDLYCFDFSDKELNSDKDFAKELWDIYCNSVPVSCGVAEETELVSILLDSAPDVNVNAPLREEPYACDMGQTTLYVLDEDMNLIRLRSEGDTNSYLDDPQAKWLCSFYDGLN